MRSPRWRLPTPCAVPPKATGPFGCTLMNNPLRIVAVSGDAGGAEGIAPVLAVLAGRGEQVRALAYRQAPALWSARALAHEVLSEETDDAECAAILRDAEADLLLVSTS